MLLLLSVMFETLCGHLWPPRLMGIWGELLPCMARPACLLETLASRSRDFPVQPALLSGGDKVLSAVFRSHWDFTLCCKAGPSSYLQLLRVMRDSASQSDTFL